MKNNKIPGWRYNKNCIKFSAKDKKYKTHGWIYNKNCIKFNIDKPK
jgi:hypothetical protein